MSGRIHYGCGVLPKQFFCLGTRDSELSPDVKHHTQSLQGMDFDGFKYLLWVILYSDGVV